MAFKTSDERDIDYELAQMRRPERRFLRNWLDVLRYPNAYFIVSIQQIKPAFLALFKSPKIQVFNEWQGEPVLIVGLWQKGELRGDLVELLAQAKSLGVYVVGANTAKLKKDVEISTHFDLYIERFNYGRDFGSYKTAILELENRYGLSKLPRLVILNDSVYFLRNLSGGFLSQMLNTEKDVLGATENFEINRHIGSFALSIGNPVLSNRKFLNFWKRYRQTDMRTKVIRRGEMKLSRILQKCATSETNFDVLYSIKKVSEFLRADPKNIDMALSLVVNNRNHWRKITVMQILEVWRKRNLFLSVPVLESNSITSNDLMDFVATPASMADGIKDVKRLYPSVDRKIAEKQIYDLTISGLLLTFASGSQIHQNGLLLHHLGCPLVKIDAIYRGAWSYEDAEKLLSKLDPKDQFELATFLYARAYGEDALRGWRRAAFMRGLI